MKRIVALGASNSKKSINKQLAEWAASQADEAEVILVDLNDYEMPIYSIDRENETGIPDKAKEFKQLISTSDGIVISFAEHNGSYSAAFKNVFDWMSRLGRPIWSDKPMFLLGTSPGGRGAKTVLETAVKTFPHQGGQVAASFSLPSFNQNFDNGVVDKQLRIEFEEANKKFEEALNLAEVVSD